MERAEAGGSRAAPGAPLADRGETVDHSRRERGGYVGVLARAGRLSFFVVRNTPPHTPQPSYIGGIV